MPALTYNVKDDKLLYVTARKARQRKSSVREGPLRLRLCDQPAAPDAADGPQEGVAKHADDLVDPAIRGRIPSRHLEEAMDRAHKGS